MATGEPQIENNLPDHAVPTTATTTLSDLHDRLDALWTTYLTHLDQYTASQKLLQTHMRDGFFSLARANFNARSGVRKYGKDFYHDRAIATRRAGIDVNDDGKASVSIVHHVEYMAKNDGDNTQKQRQQATKNAEEPKQQPSPPATPEPEGLDSHSQPEKTPTTDKSGSNESEQSRSESKPSLEADPIRWFGILVPRELRSAQNSFSSAVDGPILEAVNAARAMRETEVEIRKVRKEVRRAEKGGEGVKKTDRTGFRLEAMAVMARMAKIGCLKTLLMLLISLATMIVLMRGTAESTPSASRSTVYPAEELLEIRNLSSDHPLYSTSGHKLGGSSPFMDASQFSRQLKPSVIRRIINDNTDTDHIPPGITTYAEAVEVGAYLVAILNAPASCVPQSPWTQYSDLTKYGWTLSRSREISPTNLGQSFTALYNDLDFSQTKADNVQYGWIHKRDSQPIGASGKVYKPTYGSYRNIFNPKVILAPFNFGPDYMGRAETPPVTGTDVVPLKQWSDVVFLQWQDFCNNDQTCMRGLQAVVRTTIINPITIRITNQALQNSGKALNWWGQGQAFYDISSDEGQAILATPNGQGVVWFLAQHKVQLGQ